MGDGSVLTLMLNLADQPVALPTVLAGSPADLLYESREGAATALAAHRLPGRACVALLHAPSPMPSSPD
jgi:maltooligosyltrehalose trehalohydrolase